MQSDAWSILVARKVRIAREEEGDWPKIASVLPSFSASTISEPEVNLNKMEKLIMKNFEINHQTNDDDEFSSNNVSNASLVNKFITKTFYA